jgi:hypothetical protein
VGANPGLDRDHAHGVGYDVVQLAGKAQAFLDDRPAGQFLPGLLQFGGPLLQPGSMRTVVVDEVTQQPRRGNDQRELTPGGRVFEPAPGELDGR